MRWLEDGGSLIQMDTIVNILSKAIYHEDEERKHTRDWLKPQWIDHSFGLWYFHNRIYQIAGGRNSIKDILLTHSSSKETNVLSDSLFNNIIFPFAFILVSVHPLPTRYIHALSKAGSSLKWQVNWRNPVLLYPQMVEWVAWYEWFKVL